MIKKLGYVLLGILVIVQFFRPEKNISNDLTNDLSTKYEVPNEVKSILKVACNDCHSNLTVYPWYANIQPVAWWLNDHVVDGKKHLNFSDFTQLPIAVQNHKFEEVVEVLEENEMPLESYTYLGLHKEANLNAEQREVLMNWAKGQMAYLKNNYPADSLILKRRN
ncbi:heme-binding domain-containing protein [Namhaeicola litoreus]|uniref:Heme-binding domain-containing protein n=1 Tax=Namhaeicola litoreus TaxID=1052145 RepID=A0ABW3Y305_9FLAO